MPFYHNTQLLLPEQIPLVVARPLVYLDCLREATITRSAGVASDQLDVSGNSHNITQGTEGSRPSYNASAINGRPALVYSKGKSMANTTIAALQSGFTIFFVAQQSNIVSGGGAFLFTQSAGFLFCRFDPVSENNKFSTFINVGGSVEPRAQVATTPVPGTPYIYSAKYNGTTLTVTMHNNGATASQTRNPAVAGTTGFVISNSNVSDLAIGAEIIYNSYLSDPVITAIARSLGYSWNIGIA